MLTFFISLKSQLKKENQSSIFDYHLVLNTECLSSTLNLFKHKFVFLAFLNQIHYNLKSLIDENGKIEKAHYGKYIGDHLSIESIK